VHRRGESTAVPDTIYLRDDRFRIANTREVENHAADTSDAIIAAAIATVYAPQVGGPLLPGGTL